MSVLAQSRTSSFLVKGGINRTRRPDNDLNEKAILVQTKIAFLFFITHYSLLITHYYHPPDAPPPPKPPPPKPPPNPPPPKLPPDDPPKPPDEPP